MWNKDKPPTLTDEQLIRELNHIEWDLMEARKAMNAATTRLDRLRTRQEELQAQCEQRHPGRLQETRYGFFDKTDWEFTDE